MEIACPKCSKKLRAPDNSAGKQVRCPKCKSAFTITASAAPTGQEHAGSSQWHVKTNDGQQYGPVSKTELDGWVTDGRLDAECQVLQDGWEQWQWADELYPQLKNGAAESGNLDFLAGQSGSSVSGLDVFGNSGPALATGGNPYASPSSSIASSSSSVGAGGDEKVTSGIRRAMIGTSPWVLFLSILGFIVCGLAALGIFVMVSFSLVSGDGRVILTAMVIGFLYLAMVVCFYGLPSFLLFRYYLGINRFMRGDNQKSLQTALDAQQKFWMVMGIMVIVGMVLSVILPFVMMAMGNAMFLLVPLHCGCGRPWDYLVGRPGSVTISEDQLFLLAH